MSILLNYFRVSFRSIMKRKSTSFIHVLGLTLGMVAGLVILLYVHYETGFDKHNKDAERIYRVEIIMKLNGEIQPKKASTMPVVIYPLRYSMPQVEVATRFFKETQIQYYTNGSYQFYRPHTLYVDPEFFKVFTIEQFPGSDTSAMRKPDVAFISERVSKQLFSLKRCFRKKF